MPGIEGLAKKKSTQEEPPPVAPAYAKMIDKIVFDRLGGKPEGYVRHNVCRLWEHTYRLNVYCKLPNKGAKPFGKLDTVEMQDKIVSWFLRFTPNGELIESTPPLPGSITATETKKLVEG